MKTARDGNINFEAGVSIFKQQFVPTVITMCFFSPVVIAQIWGKNPEHFAEISSALESLGFSDHGFVEHDQRYCMQNKK